MNIFTRHTYHFFLIITFLIHSHNTQAMHRLKNFLPLGKQIRHMSKKEATDFFNVNNPKLSVKDLHKLYVECAKLYHPDKNKEFKMAAEEAFNNINTAYKKLENKPKGPGLDDQQIGILMDTIRKKYGSWKKTTKEEHESKETRAQTENSYQEYAQSQRESERQRREEQDSQEREQAEQARQQEWKDKLVWGTITTSYIAIIVLYYALPLINLEHKFKPAHQNKQNALKIESTQQTISNKKDLENICQFIKENKSAELALLLKENPNVPVATSSVWSKSPIALADELNNHTIFLMLMEYLEKQLCIDDFPSPLPTLYDAVQNSNYKAIAYICRNEGINFLNLQKFYDRTVIFYANSACIARFLKKHNADITARDNYGYNLLYFAIANNNAQLIKEYDTSHNKKTCSPSQNAYHVLATHATTATLETFLALYRPSDHYLLEETYCDRLPEERCLELIGESTNKHVLKRILTLVRKNPLISHEEIALKWHMFTSEEQLKTYSQKMESSDYKNFKKLFKNCENNKITINPYEFPLLLSYAISNNDGEFLQELVNKGWSLRTLDFDQLMGQNFIPTFAIIACLEKNNAYIDYSKLLFKVLTNHSSLDVVNHCITKLNKIPKDLEGNTPWHTIARHCKKLNGHHGIELIQTLESKYQSSGINEINTVHHVSPFDILYDQEVLGLNATCAKIEKMMQEISHKKNN